MVKSLLSVLAVSALLCGSVFAAPVALTNAQMDGVTAAGVFDYVFGDGGGVNQASDNDSTAGLEATIAAADCGSNAVAGEDNTITSAIAEEGGIANNGNDNTLNDAAADNGANAVSGNDNTAVAVNLVGNDVALDLSQKEADDESALATENGQVFQNQADDFSAVATDEATATTQFYEASFNDDSNIVVGDCNEQYVDAVEIEDVDIEEGGMGQIAKTAEAYNSFNVKDVEIDVDVDIDDSFNTEENTLDVCGQDSLTAIVNANALDDQNIGVNLNIATATTACPETDEAGNGAVSSFDGNAIAATLASQLTANNVLVLAF